MFLGGKHNIVVAVIVIILLCTALVTYAVGEEYTRQKYRPLIGGIQIHMIKWLGGIIPIDRGKCTIGYSAIDPNGRLGVITAGHCVDFETDISVYQPEYDFPWGSNYIGNPSWTTTYNPYNYFDIAFIPNSDVAPNILYTTESYASPIIIGWVYDFDIVVSLLRWGGIPVNKTGRTTGTTGGVIYGAEDPCRVNIEGQLTHVRFCINTTLYSLRGDSGSPVYQKQPRIGAILIGILIATNSNPNNPYSLVQSISAAGYFGYAPYFIPPR